MHVRSLTHRLGIALLGTVAAPLALAPVASAHVTVHPNQLPAGQFVQAVVRVPNERPNASTTRVDVKFPHGVLFLSYAPLPGWKAQVVYRKLATPITMFGEQHTQEVDRVIWSGDGKAGAIAPGQFMEFPVSMSAPDKAGSTLTFKALQTYSNGEVVRWIGGRDADEPAPRVSLGAAASAIADVPAGVDAMTGGAAAGAEVAPAAPAASAPASAGDGSRENVALGLGIGGMALGAAALLMAVRRRPRTA